MSVLKDVDGEIEMDEDEADLARGVIKVKGLKPLNKELKRDAEGPFNVRDIHPEEVL